MFFEDTSIPQAEGGFTSVPSLAIFCCGIFRRVRSALACRTEPLIKTITRNGRVCTDQNSNMQVEFSWLIARCVPVRVPVAVCHWSHGSHPYIGMRCCLLYANNEQNSRMATMGTTPQLSDVQSRDSGGTHKRRWVPYGYRRLHEELWAHVGSKLSLDWV